MEATIVSAVVETEDGPTEVGVLKWLGETTRDARELLSGVEDETTERDEITAIIRDYLIECGGSAPASDVLKVTRAAGLTDNAVKKARKKASVRTVKNGFDKGWVWTVEPVRGGEGIQYSSEGTEGALTPVWESSVPSGHLVYQESPRD